jgi:serine/threonine protein kinase
MADDVTPKLPQPGHIVGGKYEVVRPIGKGGMGVVYEALHLKLQQRVAIKMLYPHVRGAPGAIERFEREARAAGQLRSVNVARVLDVETDPGELPYIVMEFLEGNDLNEEIARHGRLPIEQAVDYVLQACTAMREAHFLGIVHRDLKPANLFLCNTADGPIIKVLDFGISKITSEMDGRLTGPLQTIGSPVYMSPEQLRGLREVDARADLWALGVTLFELIAGKPPFKGTVTATIASILSDPPPRPSALRTDVPVGLDEVVLKALSKKARDRYQDAEAMAEALLPFASAEGVRRLRAGMTAQITSTAPQRLAALAGDRDAPTVVSQRDSKNNPASTAQAWSTAPLGRGVSPRRRVALILSVGVVTGVAAALVLALSTRAPVGSDPVGVDPASATLAPPEPVAQPTSIPSTGAGPATPSSGSGSGVSSPGVSAAALPAPSVAPSPDPWVTVAPAEPALPADPGPSKKPAAPSPRRPPPAHAKANPLHL